MPKPTVDVDEEVQVQPEAKVDQTLLKMYDKLQQSKQRTGTLQAEIIEYVKNNDISKATLRITLKERGLSDASISSEVSRIFKFAAEENAQVLEDMKEGKITINRARQAITNRVNKPDPEKIRQRNEERIKEFIEKAVRIAYKHYDGDVEELVTVVRDIWSVVEEEKEERESEAEAA
jgi:hypothetical protein